jgi:hypothetical protein
MLCALLHSYPLAACALQEIWYQLAFEGYPPSEAEWFPANRIRTEYPSGKELIESFEVRSSSSS